MPDPAFGWESLESVAADPHWRSLIEQQWRDLANIPDYPEPDYRQGFHWEKAGSYRIWTARQDQLVGFIQWQIIPPLGYRNRLWAFDCGHYVDPRSCDIWVWLAMWRSAEEALRALGVSVVRGHDNHKRPLKAAFRRLGYGPVSTYYQRVL